MSEDYSEEPSDSYFFFKEYANGVKKEIKNIDYTKLPKYNNKTLDKIRNDIIKKLDSISDEDLNSENTNTELDKFFNDISSQIFDNEILQKILYTFPTIFPMSHESNVNKKEIKNLTLYFISIIQGSKKPLTVLHYMISHFLFQRWHRNKSASNDTVKNFCLCRNKKDAPLVAPNSKSKDKSKKKDVDALDPKMYTDFSWVIINQKKILYIYPITNGKFDTSNIVRQPYSEIKSENGMIKIINQGNVVRKLYPIKKDQMNIFLSQADFPNVIYSIPKYIPNEIYEALYQAITNDDLLVIRAIAHYTVTKVADGMDLCDALIKIFSFAKKTNALLSVLVGMEFENPKLTNENILRTNSHLTNMFKIINRKYGQEYFNKVIKPLRSYITKKGDIGLKDPKHANEKEAKTMFFTVFKYILASGQFVSPQMRHVINLLRSYSGIRFNHYQSVYNAISGYFYLRFFSSAIVDPTLFDSSLPNDEDMNSSIILPFLQILQTVFNLKFLHGRMERFSDWNQMIKKHIFPKLIPFTFSLAEINEMPIYEPPSSEELTKSLEVVINTISDNHDKFQKRYSQLKSLKFEPYPPVGWPFGSFLCEFFKNYGEVDQ